MKNIVVTGGRGFLGQALTRMLEQRGHSVRLLEGDVRSICSKDQPADLVFHLAGVTGDDRFQKAPQESFDINVVGTQAVLDYCAKHSAGCVFTSTSGVYESQPQGVLVKESSPVRGTRPYALSKLLGEKLCEHASRARGIPVTVLRLFNIYGAGQRQPFLVPYLVESIKNDIPLKLRMPDAVRDFVHIRDAVEAMTRCIENTAGFRLLNVGSGKGTRVMDVVRMIESLAGKSSRMEVIGSHEGELGSVIADSTYAQEALGWSCRVPLDEGIREMVKGPLEAGA